MPSMTVTIKSKSASGRWRAGLQFNRQATELDVAALTPEQLRAIQADPELVITGDIEAVLAADAGKGSAKSKPRGAK